MSHTPPDGGDDDGGDAGDRDSDGAGPLPLFPREDEVIDDLAGHDADLVRLLRAPTRVAIINALATACEPLTVAELAEWSEHVSTSSFSDHREVLVKAGVVEIVGETETGADRFALDLEHPVAAVLAMAARVAAYRETSQLVGAEWLVEDGGGE